MLVRKQAYSLDTFEFETAGRSIPVKIGYETYGTLNAKKDNCVLICHFFTGTSHAAGKYDVTDPLPGWWDTLVGPGMAIDTDKYFVVCTDTFSNINFHNPNVISTGPASIDPLTGREYGMQFPLFTLKDVVRCQKKLMESLGVDTLHMVIGPSMGGLQTFMWGRYFPGHVEKLVAIAATPELGPYSLMVPNQLGIDAIMLDPLWNGGNYYGKEPPLAGLLLAFKILLTATRTESWANENFGRKFADPAFTDCENPFHSYRGKFLVEKEIENLVLTRMQFFDPNSYIYIAKANTLFDLRENGESLEEALGKISPPVLMIIDESDLIFTKYAAENTRRLIPRCETFYYNSRNGHLSCIYETGYFEKQVREFLNNRL